MVGRGLGVVEGGWGGWGRKRDLVEEKRQGQPKQKEDKRVNQLLTVKGWYYEQDGGLVGKELALTGCSVRGRV